MCEFILLNAENLIGGSLWGVTGYLGSDVEIVMQNAKIFTYMARIRLININEV